MLDRQLGQTQEVGLRGGRGGGHVSWGDSRKWGVGIALFSPSPHSPAAKSHRAHSRLLDHNDSRLLLVHELRLHGLARVYASGES